MFSPFWILFSLPFPIVPIPCYPTFPLLPPFPMCFLPLFPIPVLPSLPFSNMLFASITSFSPLFPISLLPPYLLPPVFPALFCHFYPHPSFLHLHTHVALFPTLGWHTTHINCKFLSSSLGVPELLSVMVHSSPLL